MLRDEVASGSSLGKELNEVMQAGKLVSNKQVLDLLQAAINKHKASSKGFLIDGYPREVCPFLAGLFSIDFILFISGQSGHRI